MTKSPKLLSHAEPQTLVFKTVFCWGKRTSCRQNHAGHPGKRLRGNSKRGGSEVFSCCRQSSAVLCDNPLWHSCFVLGADFSLLFQSTGHSRFKVLRRLLWLVQVLYAWVLAAVECQKVRVLSWSVLGMGERMSDLDSLTMRGQSLREEIVLYKKTYPKKIQQRNPRETPN